MWSFTTQWYLVVIVFILNGCVSGNDNDQNKAIQIVETKELENGTKILKTIDKHSDGPSLQEVLAGQFKDLPVLVYSITGKTRGGKSFLLNMMYKYLEAQGKPGWETGTVANVFAWEDGIDSCTRGLWITPTVFRRKNSNGQEVGILLMDNQGLFDGEVTSGESVAMSGVSTIISYLQMFNMKEKISTNDMEQIMLNLVPNKPQQTGAPESGSSLMFVVRDFVGGRRYGYGLENGTKYIELEQQRGTEEYQSMWQTHRSVFDKIQCVLFPHPGLIVMTDDFTVSGNLNLLDKKFISTVNTFFDELFSPKNLNPRKGGLTGGMIYSILKKVNGSVADEKLSYYNMFLDRNNEDIKQKLVGIFEKRLGMITDLSRAGSLVEEVLSQGEFKGTSAEEYLASLRKTCEGFANARVQANIEEQYNRALKDVKTKSRHNDVWRSVTSHLKNWLLGQEYEKSQLKREIIKKLAPTYYKTLRMEKEKHFKYFCEHAKSQEFYDKMTSLDTPGDLQYYANTQIDKHSDFEKAGGSKAELNEILVVEQQMFKDNVHKSLLRNMYKVKEYFINDYSNKLGKWNIEENNRLSWPDIKNRIYSLEFETQSERNQVVNDLVRDMVGMYYSRLSNEEFDKYERMLSSYNNQGFLNEFNIYKNPDKIRYLTSAIFPEFSDFSNFSYKWQEEKSLLENDLQLALYKEYQRRGYRFHSSACSFPPFYQIVMLLTGLLYLVR